MTIVTLPALALRSDLSNFSAPPGSAERSSVWPPPPDDAGAAAVEVAGWALPPPLSLDVLSSLEPQPAATSAVAPMSGMSLYMLKPTQLPAKPSQAGKNLARPAANPSQ